MQVHIQTETTWGSFGKGRGGKFEGEKTGWSRDLKKEILWMLSGRDQKDEWKEQSALRQEWPRV